MQQQITFVISEQQYDQLWSAVQDVQMYKQQIQQLLECCKWEPKYNITTKMRLLCWQNIVGGKYIKNTVINYIKKQVKGKQNEWK